jgi:outer membrane protein
MRVTSIALLSGLVFVSPTAFADVIGLGANVSYWHSDLSGTASKGSDRVDVENDLELDNDSNINLSAALEHPIPLLPNVRLNYTAIEQSGRGEIGSDSFDGIPAGVPVDSSLDIDQIDLTLYYELLDNWVNLDGGLTVRSLDGELTIKDPTALQTTLSRTEVQAVFPMVYAAARFDLPFTGVSAGVEGNGISFDGDSVFDINVYGQYDVSVLRLRAGYRQMNIDYEDGNDTLDVEIGGPFISAGVDF